MDNDKKELLKNFGAVSTMGISMAISIAIGVYLGIKIDGWLGTKPWFFFIFMFIGIAAGFKNIFILAAREKRNNSDDENDHAE